MPCCVFALLRVCPGTHLHLRGHAALRFCGFAALRAYANAPLFCCIFAVLCSKNSALHGAHRHAAPSNERPMKLIAFTSLKGGAGKSTALMAAADAPGLGGLTHRLQAAGTVGPDMEQVEQPGRLREEDWP
ncbi:hypothetical protein DLJ53_34420 [Acuticoccus sediminis]|uniref:Uncharacterized protein n=1 Tax=Acuticoccus sediminis TaxID=2184697 RepID=A0A8B2NGN2_9HYPH|nr:hypothetical protein DLJ53_34420 [Acuticoccus sediminis]